MTLAIHSLNKIAPQVDDEMERRELSFVNAWLETDDGKLFFKYIKRIMSSMSNRLRENISTDMRHLHRSD